MNLGALRQELAAQHVTLSVSEAGKLKYDAPSGLPASLVDAMREHKTALLEGLQNEVKRGNAAPVDDSKRLTFEQKSADPLPAHLAELVDLAHAGGLPRGAVQLSRGLVTDLAAYVLAWAECWPRDRAHILSRLEEAHAATNTKMLKNAVALASLERPA